MELVWEIFCSRIRESTKPGGPHVNAFVLMHNHFHLLLTEKVSRIGKTAEKLCKNITYDFEGYTGEELTLFDFPPDQSLISDFKHLRHVYRYIYQNPVKAGIVNKAENYKFSSLYYLLGRKSDNTPLDVADTFGVIYDPIRLLQWINDPKPDAEFLHLH